MAYTEWLSQETGKRYRLPTEAEWEYAARAGTSTPFHFGETMTPNQVNYDGNYPYNGGAKGAYRQKTVATGTLPANAWGLHEVHGNVYEWTCSAYDEGYGGGEKQCTNKNSGGRRVVRGGSWNGSGRYCRSAFRLGFTPGRRDYVLGFRLALGH